MTTKTAKWGSQKEESMAFEHVSVLLHETVDGLNVKPDGIYVDARWVEADMHMKSVQSLASRGD